MNKQHTIQLREKELATRAMTFELTTDSPMSHYGIPVLRYGGKDYGPADYIPEQGITAAFFVTVECEQWGQLDRELSCLFCGQWAEGPQICGDSGATA